jgi:hypothetical protein
VIDWNNAPEWAKYHAFDKSKRGFWYEYVPSQDIIMWIPHEMHRVMASKLILTAGMDWKRSLVERGVDK